MSVFTIIALMLASVFVPESAEQFTIEMGPNKKMVFEVRAKNDWVLKGSTDSKQQLNVKIKDLNVNLGINGKSQVIDTAKILGISKVSDLKLLSEIVVGGDKLTFTSKKNEILINTPKAGLIKVYWP